MAKVRKDAVSDDPVIVLNGVDYNETQAKQAKYNRKARLQSMERLKTEGVDVAVRTLIDIAQHGSEKNALRAAEQILNRVFGKPTTTIDVSSSSNVEIGLAQTLREYIDHDNAAEMRSRLEPSEVK